jgi:hypothetical protein
LGYWWEWESSWIGIRGGGGLGRGLNARLLFSFLFFFPVLVSEEFEELEF